MRYNELTPEDKVYFIREHTQGERVSLQEHFGIAERTVRLWAMKLGLTEQKPVGNILIYDLETSLVDARIFWPGKQYISASQIKSETRIITVAYKWLGDNKVHHLSWDDGDDKQLIKDFLEVYNHADAVIGVNNDNFDNRLVNARAMRYNLDVNIYVRSIDIQKMCKPIARMHSYSMKEMAIFFGVRHKQATEGIIMWELVENGTPEEKKEYLQKMIDYNVGDILTTEELYLYMRKYLKVKTHMGVLYGGEKYSCPTCGGKHLELMYTTTTAAGTIQRVMRCAEDGAQFKLNNTQYLKYKGL